MDYLYRFEAKGIQSYILATERLREMLGASALVESLAEKVSKCCGEVISSAAGGATVVFKDLDLLKAWAEEWPLAVSKEIPGLQIVQAWAPGTTREAFKQVLAGLESARNCPVPALPEVGPLIARSGRTGRPAVSDGKLGLLDASTARKERSAGSGRDVLIERIGLSSDQVVTNDMEEFGEGYVAVVHIDGNGIGRRVIDTISHLLLNEQKAFSAALTMTTEAATKKAAGGLLARKKKDGPLMFRPLVLGGDDFTAILRAEDAIPFVEAWLLAFKKESEARQTDLRGPLTAAAGIAIVKKGYPFHAAYHLAEELCRLTKQRLPGASGLSFHRVSTSMFESLEAVLSGELSAFKDPGAEIQGALLGGPWSLAGVKALRELAAVLDDVPRGSVREWLRLVRIDASRAHAHWSRVMEIVERQDGDAILKRLRAAFSGCGANSATAWSIQGTTTPVLDATVWRSVAPNGEARKEMS